MIKAAYKGSRSRSRQPEQDHRNHTANTLDRFIVTQCRFGTCAGAELTSAWRRRKALQSGSYDAGCGMKPIKTQPRKPESKNSSRRDVWALPRTWSPSTRKRKRAGTSRGNTSSANGSTEKPLMPICAIGEIKRHPDGRWGEPHGRSGEGVLGCTYLIGLSIQIDAGVPAQGGGRANGER